MIDSELVTRTAGLPAPESSSSSGPSQPGLPSYSESSWRSRSWPFKLPKFHRFRTARTRPPSHWQSPRRTARAWVGSVTGPVITIIEPESVTVIPEAPGPARVVSGLAQWVPESHWRQPCARPRLGGRGAQFPTIRQTIMIRARRLRKTRHQAIRLGHGSRSSESAVLQVVTTSDGRLADIDRESRDPPQLRLPPA